jgi:hypothetical protein
VIISKAEMMEIITWAAAQAIAKIALDKFVEGGSSELGKKLTDPVAKKVMQLGTIVWDRIKGNTAVVTSLEGAAQEQPEDVQKLKNYLYSLWKDERAEFAADVKTLVNEIHFELTQIEDNSSMTQNNYGGTNYQTKTGANNTNFFGGEHHH